VGRGLQLLWAVGQRVTNNIEVPEPIVGGNVTAIAAGWCTGLFLKSDGSFVAMASIIMAS